MKTSAADYIRLSCAACRMPSSKQMMLRLIYNLHPARILHSCLIYSNHIRIVISRLPATWKCHQLYETPSWWNVIALHNVTTQFLLRRALCLMEGKRKVRRMYTLINVMNEQEDKTHKFSLRIKTLKGFYHSVIIEWQSALVWPCSACVHLCAYTEHVRGG